MLILDAELDAGKTPLPFNHQTTAPPTTKMKKSDEIALINKSELTPSKA
jgi:hypothetical protein